MSGAAPPEAALPMYDRPETRAANARFWGAIRARRGAKGADLPRDLGHPEDLWAHWMSPGLVFSQTCGLPLVDRLRGRVAMIGTPDYGLPGCPAGHYNSVFVIRKGDGRRDPGDWPALRVAVNSRNSQSGWGAPQNFMTARGLSFADVVLTGSHRRSAQAVAEGAADIACIDAFTWSMMRRRDAEARALEEVDRTEPTPGLPYITAPGRAHDGLREAVAEAIGALSREDRDLLGLRGIVDLSFAAYDAVPVPPFPRATAQEIA